MSPRARVVALVALVAAATAAGTVAVTLVQTRGESTTPRAGSAKPRPGAPPVWFSFGLRQDREARDLTRASVLLDRGKHKQAAAIFGRYRSLQAQIGLAFARWPGDGLDELKRLVAAHPGDPVAELHLGYAYYWAGRTADAVASWQRVVSARPDSPEAVRAEDLLYAGRGVPGLPPVTTPLAPERLTASGLRALARAADGGDEAAKIRYGAALWQLWHRVSAERQFAAAVRLAPDDPAARTLAAVGLFRKQDPVRAFSVLGPLTGEFPRAAVVRYHLGLLLIWTRQVERGLAQLRLAALDQPGSVYAKEAKALLSGLAKHGTR